VQFCSHAATKRSQIWKMAARNEFIDISNVFPYAAVYEHLTADAKLLADEQVEPDTTTVCTVKDIETNRFDDDCVVIGVLYKILHFKHDAKEAQERNTFAKKPRREYDRILEFGALDGQTFCVLFPSSQAGATAFKLNGEVIGVGRAYMLVNPTIKPRSTLKGGTKILKISEQLLPLQQSFIPLIPNINYADPTSGKDSFFVKHNLTDVHIPRKSILILGKHGVEQACCSGYLCDRQKAGGTGLGCGCFDFSGRIEEAPTVMYYDFNSRSANIGDLHLEGWIKGVRSLRSLQLFTSGCEGLGGRGQGERLVEQRFSKAAVVNCVTHVNQQAGGFTIMGYATLGKITDYSNPHEKVDSTTPTVRLTYLFPTNVTIPSTDQFKALMHTYGDRPAAPNHQHAVNDAAGQQADGAAAARAVQVAPRNSQGQREAARPASAVDGDTAVIDENADNGNDEGRRGRRRAGNTTNPTTK